MLHPFACLEAYSHGRLDIKLALRRRHVFNAKSNPMSQEEHATDIETDSRGFSYFYGWQLKYFTVMLSNPKPEDILTPGKRMK